VPKSRNVNVLGVQHGCIAEVVLDALNATVDSMVKIVVFFSALHTDLLG
jgi:hypothetical protein